MPIDPITGVVTYNGSEREIQLAVRNRNQIEAEQRASANGRAYVGPVNSAPSMEVSGPLKWVLNLIIIGFLWWLISANWKSAANSLHRGDIFSIGIGAIFAFFSLMIIIAVVVVLWRFLARIKILGLASLAVLGWLGYKMLFPHPVPMPNLTPIHAVKVKPTVRSAHRH